MVGLPLAAGGHLPAFITAPGETDYLLVICGFLLVGGVLAIGIFFLWLHALPERMVHNKWQYDIVAVLCLLALFTHIHAFWIAALLLAMVKIPDISFPDYQTPLRGIQDSIEKLSTDLKSTARPAARKNVPAKPAGQGAGE